MNGYYVVMAYQLRLDGAREWVLGEYTGRHWGLDQELEAQEELWDARHDGEVEDAYLKEVIF